MINALFDSLSGALHSTTLVALGASFIWGILSIILSPCHLASIPLIVGFIDDQGNISTKRAFILSSLFSLGILITIAAIGVITAMMGRMLGDIGAWSDYVVGLVFLLVGFHLMGFLPLPFMGGVNQPGIKKKGLVASFLLGLIFGIALGPCTFAYMAPMLALSFSLASTQPIYASTLLVVYGIGHCAVIVVAGTSTELVEKYLQWNEGSKGAVILKKMCGALVVLAGVYMLIF